MAGERVLIIEDDPAMLRGLKDNFAKKGYRVATANDGEAGYEAALTQKPDLIVLDIMIPKLNGFELCRLLRAEGVETPVIMLTAKGEESDIVLGLNLGADDYVTKPFSIRELLARSAALLRRRARGEPRRLGFGPFTLDADSRRLLREGHEVALTPKEFGLLALLAGRPGRVFTRDQILGAVWGRAVIVTGRSVDRCVATLRSKIEPDPRRPTYIKTARQVGYRLDQAGELKT
jgi:DNA-binding response OmpR family regulator